VHGFVVMSFQELWVMLFWKEMALLHAEALNLSTGMALAWGAPCKAILFPERVVRLCALLESCLLRLLCT
jgi:hypothetical protein